MSLSFTQNIIAQVSHTVNAGSFYYSPAVNTISQGDTVKWINDGGFHDVNADISTLSSMSFNNPVSFQSSPTGTVGAVIYTHIFTVPGTYNYDCSIGNHAAQGMVGTIIVLPSSSPTITSVTYTHPLCFGAIVGSLAGSVDITINQSTPPIGLAVKLFRQNPISGLWSPSGTSYSTSPSWIININFPSLQAGDYRVDLIDTTTGLLIEDDFFTLVNPPPLLIDTLITTPESSNGAFDGSAYVVVSSGVSPYNVTNGGLTYPTNGSFIWPSLAAGIFCLTVTDNNGCSTTTCDTIGLSQQTYGCTDSLAINYDSLATIDDSSCVYCDLSIDSLAVTQMTCFTYNNASVNIIATGTQPLPYNYYVVRLNPTDTVSQGNLGSYNGLGAGTFVAMVEDNLGCIDSDTFTINSTDSVYIDSVIYSNVSCNGMANGYISAIIPMGGTPPYQFSLNGGPLYQSCLCVVSPSCPTGYVFSGLSPGAYTVEIWDSNMCANSYQIFITEPPLIIWQQAFSICDGDSVLVGSSVYHINGNYIDTLTAGSGCDSIVYTNISIAFPTIWYQTHLICDGDSIAVGNNVYDTAGVYIDTLSSANGCDSIIQTYLMVEQNTYSYDTLVIGASIVWNGIPLNVSGDYSVTLINSVGCDSIANLNLTITNTTGLLDVTNTEKTLLKITDILGQETPYRKNTPLFYIYDDGTVEKRIVIE